MDNKVSLIVEIIQSEICIKDLLILTGIRKIDVYMETEKNQRILNQMNKYCR